MPSELNVLPKAKRPLATIAYPTVAMSLYVHGPHHKFAEGTRIWCHILAGSAIFQVGTHGANCEDCNRVGYRIANLQRIVAKSRVAKSDCMRVRSKVHKFILDALQKNNIKLSMSFYFQPVVKPEPVNKNWNQYLRNLLNTYQRDWTDYVGWTEFSRNVDMHLATKGSSFMMAYGVRSNLLVVTRQGTKIRIGGS